MKEEICDFKTLKNLGTSYPLSPHPNHPTPIFIHFSFDRVDLDLMPQNI